MHVPDGYTEEQVLQIISRIADGLSHQFTFGSYEIDDIRQEIFLMADEALPRYTAEKSQLQTFLTTHIRNRLLNLRRDKYSRPYGPCSKCKQKNECVDGSNCERYQKWVERNAAKRNLADSVSSETFSSEDDVVDIDKEILRNELMRLIDRNLPVALRGDYRRLIEGDSLPKRRKSKVLEQIREILKDYDYE